MHIVSIDPILLLGLIFVAFVFWVCVFLDNMFRKKSSRKRGKRHSSQEQKNSNISPLITLHSISTSIST